MARVLKFRAWDPVTKQWLAEGFHLFGEVTCFDIVRQKLTPNPAKPDEPSLLRLNDVIVTQFTGLLDKHGTEIYEGDVLKGGRIIAFGKIGYDGSWNGLTGFHFKPNNQDDDFMELQYHDDPEELEVIGNIYEHPHLVPHADAA